MKPKPFSALNHFTVPCATCSPTFVHSVGPQVPGGRVVLFRPPNTNVELEPRGTVQELVSLVTGLPRDYSPDVVPAEGPRLPREGPPSPHPSQARGEPLSGATRARGEARDGADQAMRPASRTDFRDGCTRCEGPTTGSSGSSVFSPSPVLRKTVSLAGSSSPFSTS